MLPEVGASELIVLAAVALIVVGPKDLPMLLRKVGQFVGKLRGFANDFRHSFDEMARQSELDDLRKEVEALRTNRLTDPLGVETTFDEINHSLQPNGVAGLKSDDELKAEADFWAEQGGNTPTPSILPPDAQPIPKALEEAPAAPEPGARLR